MSSESDAPEEGIDTFLARMGAGGDSTLPRIDSLLGFDLSPGRRLGGYEIGERIGAGGMGAVFRAVRASDGAEFAIKVLRPELAADEEHRARFEREVRSAAKVPDPTALQVTDVGVQEGIPFMVMPLLRGETFASFLAREAPLDVDHAVALLRPIARCLWVAHQAGVVHRDVKPGNVFLAEGPEGAVIPRLLDFGIAKLEIPGLEQLTATGTSLGTPAYMAPEQVTSSRTASAASDQFAVGVMLYEAVTGARPHEAPSPQILALLKVVQPAAPLTQHRGDLPAPFVDAVMRCLEKEPAARFANLGELLGVLAQWGANGGRWS